MQQRPTSPFIVRGRETLDFKRAFALVLSMTQEQAVQTALRGNDVENVIGWLRLEMSRHGGALPTDFVTSSGSTGAPKTFYVSLQSQVVTARAINEFILDEVKYPELLLLPLTHSSARGRLRAAVLRGDPIHLASHPFTFRSISQLLEKSSVFAMAITPATYRYLRGRTGDKFWETFHGLASLEFGSAPLTQAEQAQLLDSCPEHVQIKMHFGLSEASRSFVRDVRETLWNEIGKPMPHTFHRFTTDGELVIAGEHIAESVEVAGSHMQLSEVHTGDIFSVASGGRALFIGRNKNVLNMGGFSIFIETLEAQLSVEAGGTQILVGRGSHELLGEVPVLFVEPGKEQAALDAWGQYAVDSRSSYMPEVTALVGGVPTLPSGKLDRGHLNVLAGQLMARRTDK